MVSKTSRKSVKHAKEPAAQRVVATPTLLSGGNPQIAKGDGDAPVQAYIAAMPGWKSDSGAASTRSSCAPPPAYAKP